MPDLSEPVLHEAEPGPGPVHDCGPLREDGKLLAASQPGLVPAHNFFTYVVRRSEFMNVEFSRVLRLKVSVYN